MRLRLTLLYGALFLVAGAILLGITYLLVSHNLARTDITFISRTVDGSKAPGYFFQSMGAGSGAIGALPLPAPSGPLTSPQQAEAYANQLREAATALVAADRANTLNVLLVLSGVALAIMAVVSIGLGWLVAGRALRPLRTLTESVRGITASNLHERLAVGSPNDELRDLSQTFNGLLDRLEAAFDAQRQFVANASHELRTPLARQRTLLEVSMSDPNATVASLRAADARALAAGEQQERLIEALLTLARSERGLDRHEPVDLADIAAEALLARRREAELRGLRVEARLGAASASGDPRLVERLAANLLDHALQYNAEGGYVSVHTETRGDRAVLSVANSGPAVPPDEVDRLFEPFQRLRAARTDHGEGSGLGLSIVRAIALAHGADVDARALPEGGLDVEVRFPQAPARDADRAGHDTA
jgi:signal transduction histidine kinase